VFPPKGCKLIIKNTGNAALQIKDVSTEASWLKKATTAWPEKIEPFKQCEIIFEYDISQLGTETAEGTLLVVSDAVVNPKLELKVPVPELLQPKVFLDKCPQLSFEANKLPDKPVLKISIFNRGKGGLLVTRVSSDSDWLKGQEFPEPLNIKPNAHKSLDLNLDFDNIKPKAGKTTLTGNITISCNDPQQPQLKRTVSIHIVQEEETQIKKPVYTSSETTFKPIHHEPKPKRFPVDSKPVHPSPQISKLIRCAATIVIALIAGLIILRKIIPPTPPDINKKIIVTAIECNIRRTPGVDNNIIGTLNQRTIGTIQKVKEIKFTPWYKINTGYMEGWISSKVCRLMDDKRGKLVGFLKVHKLNVREYPRVQSSQIIDRFESENGDLLTIREIVSNGWLKVITKSGRTGYVSGEYVDVCKL